jgi:hypothetical protein
MPNTATTVQEYMDALPGERKSPIMQLRNSIREQLPSGFEERISYGMIGYVVPHSLYPPGYHVNPKLPLPFLNLASQKAYIALYHIGLYADPSLLNWFMAEYRKQTGRKPYIGKSCVRFKNTAQIPYALIGELASKMSPQQWIACYEKQVKGA